MANPEEQFCLRWNDYHESMVATLQELRNEDDFVDVTLVCEGGAEIRAHKLILSACSDFFRTLLKRTPPSPSNPVIVLWDISHSDLQHILRYMYNGEVEVQQAHLNTFLAVAERLRVRGLCQSGGKSSPIPSGHHHRPRASVSPQPPTSSSHNQSQHHHSKSSSSASSQQRRRSSLDPISSSSKRTKYDADISIKEEEQQQQQHHRNDGGRRHEEMGQPPSNPNDMAELNQSGGGSHHDDGSIMSRSGHGSEADYTEYGYGGGGGNGAGPSGGGGRGVGRVRDESERTGDDDEGDYPDPASIGNSAQLMEIWRRAAMSHLGQRFGGGSNSNSPSNSYGDSPQTPTGAEPARRQRSVYSSEQIQQLEAFFSINEYIDGERKKQLSMMTKIPEQQIKVWFQNRRQKKKRELEEHSRGGGGGGGSEPDHHRELMPPSMAREGDDVKYE